MNDATSADDGGLDTVPAAFDLLADETRWAIVRELATDRRHNWEPRGRSFADLRRAVGIDDAGRFNYHLGKLRGTFVRKNGDEYVLTNEGLELVGAVLAGEYDTSDHTRRESIDATCRGCGRSLEAIYAYGYLRIACPEHGSVAATILAKKIALRRSSEELVRVAGRRIRSRIGRLNEGVCSHCRGRVSGAVSSDVGTPDHLEYDLPPEFVAATYRCADCGFYSWLPAHVAVVDHPAVVAFRYDCGDDVGGVPYLGTELDRIEARPLADDGPESDPATDGGTAPPDGADPAAVVELVSGDDALSVWLDGDAAVIETDR